MKIAGVPVGKEITEHVPRSKEQGSIIIVVATDAPLLPHQRPGLLPNPSAHELDDDLRVGEGQQVSGAGDQYIGASAGRRKDAVGRPVEMMYRKLAALCTGPPVEHGPRRPAEKRRLRGLQAFAATRQGADE